MKNLTNPTTRLGTFEWVPPTGGISDIAPDPTSPTSPFELSDLVDKVTAPAVQEAKAPKAKLPSSMRDAWDEAHKALARHVERRDQAQGEADQAFARVIEAATAVEVARNLVDTLERTYEV